MGDIGSFLPILAMFAVVYFFMIAPQMKKSKKEKAFAKTIKKGDRVVTKSGMHGRILDFSEKLGAVIIETGAGKITFDRSAISMEASEKLNAPAVPAKESK